MAKKKRKHIPRNASVPSNAPAKDVITGQNYPTEEIKWWREAIEGLVVAIVLALLIRGFEAEAFVIPTGSMASTLRGRHKDVRCEQCEKEYAVGASLTTQQSHGEVVTTVCPICAYPQPLTYDKGRDASFSGDRILVNKFAYDPLGEPERFDVIVFKNPNDAKQNYIKRLCGLPGESLIIKRGDIYVRPLGATGDFSIAKKPPRKLRTLLQIVDDTAHVSPALQTANMPARWQPDPGSDWTANSTHQEFRLAASNGESWLRFRNYIPNFNQWRALQEKQQISLADLKPSLVSDTYAYNSYLTSNSQFPDRAVGSGRTSTFNFFDRLRGKNWVGDLAVETNIDIENESGQFLLDLVEGGWHFRCVIDVSTGDATLSILQPDGQPGQFVESATVTTSTAMKGSGTYSVLFSNIDSELRLWINNKVITFDKPTDYQRAPGVNEFEAPLRPFYGGPDNPGDAAPVGLGGSGLQANVKQIKVHRDVYYVGVSRENQDPAKGDYTVNAGYELIDRLFTSPELWATTPLFDRMKQAHFELQDFEDDAMDQFFPMGDNSPHSLDGRLWSDHYVERQFLIGEAVFIYYPHPWHVKLPGERFRTLPLLVYPKFSRMGVIR